MILLTALSLLMTSLQTKALQSDFTMTITALQSQPISYAGTMQTQGDCFQVSVLGIEVAYDGKTMYMYQSETDELTISSPTKNELKAANPLLLAKDLEKMCNITERTAKEGAETILTLTPKQQTKDLPFMFLTIRIRTSDHLPLSLEMREAKQTSLVRFTSAQWLTEKLPIQAFQLSKPKAYINDLR